jgi:biopolymer transport protein TolR
VKNKRTKRKLVAEINVVPYIDVTLVLLVVFMITAPLLMQGVKVELPVANSAPLDKQKQDPLIISIKV